MSKMGTCSVKFAGYSGVDGLNGTSSRRCFAEQEIGHAKRVDRDLSGMQDCSNARVLQERGDVQRHVRERHHHNWLVARSSHRDHESELERVVRADCRGWD